MIDPEKNEHVAKHLSEYLNMTKVEQKFLFKVQFIRT